MYAVASPILCLYPPTDHLHDPVVFCDKHPDVGRSTPSHLGTLFSVSFLHRPHLSGEHAGQLRTRSCLQLPSSLCSLSLSAWPFVSSVDLVMISVKDQSPLAEIWGHSGSWECRSEEFDICTATCNESSPLVCLSMYCIYQSDCDPVNWPECLRQAIYVFG